MMQRQFLASILLILSLLIFVGCADDMGLPGEETENEPERIISAVVSIPMEKVRTLNPLLSLDEGAYHLNKLIYDGLFAFNAGLQAEGALAESYEYGEGGTILQIRLREGVKWQDGEAFTAEDVKFTIDAYKSVPAARIGTYGPSLDLIRSAKVIDSLAIQIQFADGNQAALENLMFPILPSHKYNRPADLAKDEAGFVPMGTGPYLISSLETGKKITLSGNPNYRGTVPENTLLFKFVPKKEEAVNLFDIGEMDITYLKDINRNTLVEDKVVTMVPFLSNEVEVLGFNFSHGALQNPAVRQAIAHAVDNQMILETCYYNSGILNNTIYYPGYMGVESRGALYEYDTAKAIELLKSAEYEGLSLNLLFNAENHARNLAAQVIKSGLEKAGISVTLIPLQRDDYNTALAKGEFDLYLGGFRFHENYDLRPVLHSESDNPIKYTNPQMDGLLDKLQQGITGVEKRKTFETLHQLYAGEIPYYCLLYKTYGFAASTNLTGDIEPYFYHIYHGSENWRVSREVKSE